MTETKREKFNSSEIADATVIGDVTGAGEATGATADAVRSKIFDIDTWRKLTAEGANLKLNVYPSGVSMRPLIRGGRDKVIVSPLRRELMRGDIILFIRKDGAQVMHRVWKLGDKVDCGAASGELRIQTYGDGCWYPDEPITMKDVVGIATTLYRVKKKGDGTSARKIDLTTSGARAVTENGASGASNSARARKIDLTTLACRRVGLMWLGIPHIRRLWYRIRGKAAWIKKWTRYQLGKIHK